MSPAELDRRFVALWRTADRVGKERIQRLLAGVLGGKVTLSIDEASAATKAEIAALADALPLDSPAEWTGQGRPS